jgi:hypothetical protein
MEKDNVVEGEEPLLTQEEEGEDLSVPAVKQEGASVKIPSWLAYPLSVGFRAAHQAIPFQKNLWGAVGAITGKGYDKGEQEYLDLLKETRERTPYVGGAAEIAGAIISPTNKIGLAAKAAKPALNYGTLKGAWDVGSRAALAGGQGAAISHASDTKTKELFTQEGLTDLAKSTAIGLGLGGALGGTQGALAGRAQEKMPELLLGSVASTAGDIRLPGKAAGARSYGKEIKKALDVAEEGYKRGYIGNVGQGVKQTFEKMAKASEEFGQQGEQVRQALLQKAAAKGSPSFDTAGNVVKGLIGDVESDLLTKGRLVPGEMEALKEAKDFLRYGLMDKQKGKLSSNTPVSIQDVHNAYQKLSTYIRGARDESRDFAASVRGQVLYNTERKLKELFRQQAEKIDKKDAKKLLELDRSYHVTQTLETMAAKGYIGEAGQRFPGGLLGRVAGMSGQMVGSLLGKPGQLAGKYVGGKLAQRTVAPNTALALLKQARQGKVPQTASVAGRLSGAVTSPDYGSTGGEF